MWKYVDLTGKKFGRLTVIERAPNHIQPNGRSVIMWKCKCDCGNMTTVRGDGLKSGATKSCWCWHLEVASKTGKKFGGKNKKYNTYDLSGEYGIGYTSKGEKFYFDLEDYDKIKDYCWWISNEGYVVSKDKNRKRAALHRIVTDCQDGLMVDHIHGRQSRYDNRKSNLRIVTNQNNCMNNGLSSNNTSGVTGVHWDKLNKKWKAQIGYNYKRIQLGAFDNFEDAVAARKQAEDKYFGEYSYDNSMKGVS